MRPMKVKSDNITWQEGHVDREQREASNGQRGCVIWTTGLSGSGKSTFGARLEETLFHMGRRCYRLDGDNIRFGLNRDLGFSPEDRDENIRRIGEVARLFADAGLICITGFISPYRRERDAVRGRMARPEDFIETFLDCPLEVCEQRDVKGLYARARAGEITGFTGVDAPYEAPAAPEIRLDTSRLSLDECVGRVVEYLKENGYFLS